MLEPATGGVATAFANSNRYRVHAVDINSNLTLRSLRARGDLPIRFAYCSGTDLCFPPSSFDLVLLIDALEHIQGANRLAREILRVLKPGGLCIVTTPARLRYFFGPDPHYGVRFLVALPNSVQRLVVNRILRRRVGTIGGDRSPAYDVDHIYWSVGETKSLFQGAARVEPLYGFPLQPNEPLFSREWFRFKLRDFVFEHVLVWK